MKTCKNKTYDNPRNKTVKKFILFVDKPQCLPGQRLKYGVTIGKSALVKCEVRANPRANTQIIMKYNQLEYKTSGEYDAEDDTVFYANVTHKVR